MIIKVARQWLPVIPVAFIRRLFDAAAMKARGENMDRIAFGVLDFSADEKAKYPAVFRARTLGPDHLPTGRAVKIAVRQLALVDPAGFNQIAVMFGETDIPLQTCGRGRLLEQGRRHGVRVQIADGTAGRRSGVLCLNGRVLRGQRSGSVENKKRCKNNPASNQQS
ncbi:MAG: hypothetical protein BWY83_00734 [bacterium ADurb.Bin478]|nr:MAG: hypothetical protein BWY83_00734 [bacterium ADurb.Bin478]